MTPRTRVLYGACLLAAMPFLMHCKETTATNRYDLIIQNQTATGYEIFVNNTSGGFTSVGNLAANATVTLRNLVHGEAYTFRLCLPGQGPGTFVEERVVSSNGPDVTWTVT